MGRLEVLKDEICKLAQPLCDKLGIDLVELNVRSYNETLIVEVFVDRPTGGIQMDECSGLNQELDDLLFNQLKLGNAYTLEVSSPGLDRPLRDFRDFRRTIGRDIQVFLRQSIEGKRELSGNLKGVREAEIILETRKGEVFVPINVIDKGQQIIS